MKKRIINFVPSSLMLLLISLCFGLTTFAQQAPSLVTIPSGMLDNGYTAGTTYNMNVNFANANSNMRSYILKITNAGSPGVVGSAKPVGNVVDTLTVGNELQVFTTDTGSSPGWNFAWMAPSSGSETINFELKTNAENVGGGGTDWVWTCHYQLTQSSFGLTQNCTNNVQVGIAKNISNNQNIDIYPNPANSELMISYNLLENQKAIIEMFDLSGKRVKNIFEGEIMAGTHNLRVDVSELAKGLYTLKLALGKDVYYDKISVQ